VDTKLLIDLDNYRPNGNHIGNKAKNLVNLRKLKKVLVPKTWVIPEDVCQIYLDNPQEVSNDLKAILQVTLSNTTAYAVRSSSNIEDSQATTFAGMFTTILNVKGYDNLIQAIKEVWASVDCEGVRKYAEAQKIDPKTIKMSVIIQEMVPAVFSGVVFSQNPMTGVHEIVVEAVQGEGTALVQDGLNPERFVYRSGGWVAQPKDETMPIDVANKVLKSAEKIIKSVEYPIDLEWAYDGNNVFWVQMREITTLNALNVYSNRMSKDMMPGMIHPLIWSINVPMVNAVWIGILEELVGKLNMKPEDLAKQFYYRVYFDMGAVGEVFTRVGFPSEGLEMMMGMIPAEQGHAGFRPSMKMIRLLPKMIGFFNDKWRFERKLKVAVPEIEKALESFDTNPSGKLTAEKALEEIDRLFKLNQKIIYFNVLTPILTSVYMRGVETMIKKVGVKILEFDFTEDLPELDEYNPNVAIEELRTEYSKLSPEEKALYADFDQNDWRDGEYRNHFEEKLAEFLKKFGHFSNNSSNFMAVPWREDPSFVLKMIVDFEETDRHDNGRVGIDDLEFKGIKKSGTRFIYKRARRHMVYRDRVGSNYVHGYGLFRPYFFVVADEMIENGWLNTREDIFLLSWQEIKDAVHQNDGKDLLTKVELRRDEMERYKDIDLPDLIYGDEAPPIIKQSYQKLHGTPTSQGYYVGPVKVIHSVDEFEKVEKGDIIIIPYSDVGWTPLFVKAGAVISESGGMLSHSSIIAREYHIPAIVSVSHAMQLKDNQQVSMNGFTGDILIIDETSKNEEGVKQDDCSQRG
jgi:pyruvate,water dikinase